MGCSPSKVAPPAAAASGNQPEKPGKEPPPTGISLAGSTAKDASAIVSSTSADWSNFIKTLAQSPADARERALASSCSRLFRVRATVALGNQISMVGEMGASVPLLVQASSVWLGQVGSDGAQSESVSILLESTRWAVRGVLAGKFKGKSDISTADSLRTALPSELKSMRRAANRGAQALCANGGSPAEHVLHLAAIQSTLDAMPDPKGKSKSVGVAFNLLLGAAKTVAKGGAVDAQLMEGLKGAASMGMDVIKRRMNEGFARIVEACDNSALSLMQVPSPSSRDSILILSCISSPPFSVVWDLFLSPSLPPSLPLSPQSRSHAPSSLRSPMRRKSSSTAEKRKRSSSPCSALRSPIRTGRPQAPSLTP